jgi:ribosomal protein S18 acetylase RimI-like enzyme
MKIDLSQSPLQQAGRRDWRKVADITAEAFADDPVNRWVFGSPRAIQSAFRVMMREMYLKHGQCYLHGDDGATAWLTPGVDAPFTGWTGLQFALGQARFGSKGAMKRASRLGEIMAEHHPETPHMYLFTIGTTQAARGKGVGKALLAPVLAACDAQGVPVYLENSNPANTGFYRAYGFERIGLFEVGEGGPVMEPMWRAPTGGASA